MQQPMGDQIGQQQQATMVQSQQQMVQQQQQQQHMVQQQQMLQPQQQIMQQQPQLLQQPQILQPQPQLLQQQQQMLQGQQQVLPGQQQMLPGQQQQQLVQQIMPQQLGQQMMYCPTVRLVYDTPMLMQGTDQIQQQNQGLFVNQPPWARQVQNQVIYVQQIGSNLVPIQHIDPNLYLHQNVPMYQQVVQNVPQLVQNLPQNVQQIRPVVNNIPGLIQNFGAAQNVQDQNVTQLQNVGFIQANQNVSNANVSTNNEERRINSPMTQQNNQTQDTNQLYRQIVAQVNQPQVRQIQMSNQVQNVPTNVQIGQQISNNIGQNTNANVRQINNNMAQNAQTSIGQNVRQVAAQVTPSSIPIQTTNQNVRIVSSNVATHMAGAQNIHPNMQQVRHIMPQAVNFTPRGIPQQNLINASIQTANPISALANVATVTYTAVRNGHPYTYKAIQPKPNANIRNYTPRPQVQMVRKPPPNHNQTNTSTATTANASTAPSNYVKTETETSVFNKKRKSESPDEVQKKVSNYGSVTVTSQVKEKVKAKSNVHTSEIGVNTSPIHRPKVPVDSQNQPLLQIYPMEAKVKQEFHKNAEMPNQQVQQQVQQMNQQMPVQQMNPNFNVKTETAVDSMTQTQQTMAQNQAEWYAKYHNMNRQEHKNEQVPTQQNIPATMHQIQQHQQQQFQQATSQHNQQHKHQAMSQSQPSQLSQQSQSSQQSHPSHQPISHQVQQLINQPIQQHISQQQPVSQPNQQQISHPVQQLISQPNQQHISQPVPQQISHPVQQLISQQSQQQHVSQQTQQLISQQTSSHQMASQQTASHQMASQQMASQQTASQQTASQQTATQQTQPPTTKKDMGQQTEEKLVRKTVFPQATTRGRMLDDKTNISPPKVEEIKQNILSNAAVNTQQTNVPHFVQTQPLNNLQNFVNNPRPEVSHIPIKPIEQNKKIEEKSNKMEESKSLPMLPVTSEQLPKITPIKNENIPKTEPAVESKKEVKTSSAQTISDSLKEIIRDSIAKKDEIKTETHKVLPVDTIKTEIRKSVDVKTETEVKTEKTVPLEGVKQEVKATKINTDFEKVIKDNKIEKKEYKNITFNEMTGKEILMADGNIRKEEREKEYILTHVLDGYVIQESNVPFAIRRPLKEKTVNSVGEEKEKVEPSLKNLTCQEMKDKIMELSQLHIEDGRERRNEGDLIKENDENKVIEGGQDAANPFRGLDQNVVRSWTMEDLTSHLAKHEWMETVSLLREHEIDGESLFLVTKNQLVTIGLNESHAELICDFVGNRNY